VGVWARRHDAAVALADAHGTTAASSLEELCGRSDALVFCVPPDVQARYAVQGALAGKALLLEKPLSLDLGAAEELARVVTETNVPTQMVFTWRYSQAGQSFVADARTREPSGARAAFLNGGMLGGVFATPWRLEYGPLFDLGPHVLDMLDAALGEVTNIVATGDRRGWVNLHVTHARGTHSDVSLCATLPMKPDVATVDVYSRQGTVSFDANDAYGTGTMKRVIDEFVATVATKHDHPLDVRHGLRIQRLLDLASRQLP
jgi:predicted dehydrogenase